MNIRNVAILLAVFCCSYLAGPILAYGDPTPSHRRLPGANGSFDERELAERLQPAQDMNALRELAEKILKNPDKFSKVNDQQKALLEQFLKNQDVKKLLQDKALQDLFRESLKNPKVSTQQLEELHKRLDQLKPEDVKKWAEKVDKQPQDFKLDDKERDDLRKLADQLKKERTPEDLARWTELAKKLQQNPSLPNQPVDPEEALKRTLPSVTLPPPVTEGPPDIPSVKPPMPNMQDTPPPPMQTNPDPMGTTPPSIQPSAPEVQPPMPPAPEDVNDVTETTLSKVANWLNDLDPDGEHLNYLTDFIRTMRESKGEETGSLDTIGKAAEWLGSLNLEEWHFSHETAETANSWLDKIKGSSAPSASSGSSSISPASAMGSGSSSLDLDKLAKALAWVLSLAIVGFAAWLLAMWYRARMAIRNAQAMHWPVLPTDVTTRGDLVRAFEYLALKLLGLDAQHRHHLDLAKRLGGSAAKANNARQQAANHLAHLYELARYAPEDEPLPEQELAAARHDLSFLAGVAAA